MSYSQNNLKESNNPYLLQHAQNPVHWQTWSEEIFQVAQQEQRLVLVSIGYSSCHWCHVMEENCFEDQEVAAVMNAHYYSIKVDREERPDLDDHYMSALQLMTGQGGWPLNVICLPDGRPVWGATYVPKDRWMEVLRQLDSLYRETPQKFEEYATALQNGMAKSRLVDFSASEEDLLSKKATNELFDHCRQRRDQENGGALGAPKFPMPGLLQCFQHYAYRSKDPFWEKHLALSLDHLARGGIYDQIGGGFARYTTDGAWKVPHFEKMLYDNAQLLSLYGKAYRESAHNQYQTVITETLSFLEREMRSAEGLYYSAIDADSEGEEGKFYVWTKAACRKHIPEKQWAAFQRYYGLEGEGLWEKDQYILLRPYTDAEFCQNWPCEPAELKAWKENWQATLLSARAKRPRPFTDQKAITAWNGLLVSGFCEAYRALGQPEVLERAQSLAEQILVHLYQEGQLFRIRMTGQTSQKAFLDDYAALINAWLDLYEVTGQVSYADQALSWTEEVRHRFRQKERAFFKHRPVADKSLISNNAETSDNVIPSANALMAKGLFRLAQLYHRDDLAQESRQLLTNMLDLIEHAPESHYQWLDLLMQWQGPHYQIALTGKERHSAAPFFIRQFLPHSHLAWSKNQGKLPALESRPTDQPLGIFICQEGLCKAPTDQVEQALEQLAL